MFQPQKRDLTELIARIRIRYRYPRILLRAMVVTDFKLRYQASLLGYLWTILRPLAIFTILYIVFVKFLRLGASTPYYPVYLLFGIVIWGFFVEATTQGLTSLVARADLLRKISFPRYVVVLSIGASVLISFALNMLVIVFFMALLHVPVRLDILWLPPLFLELVALSISLAFFLSALYVRFRDLNYIWEVCMQAAFYAVPILYPLTLVPARYARLLILNPIAQIIQDARYVLVTDRDADDLPALRHALGARDPRGHHAHPGGRLSGLLSPPVGVLCRGSLGGRAHDPGDERLEGLPAAPSAPDDAEGEGPQHASASRGPWRSSRPSVTSASTWSGVSSSGSWGATARARAPCSKILAGIYMPTRGSVAVGGKLVPFIELGVGFNPELTGRENVYLNGALLGFSKGEIDAMYDDIVAFAELEESMDQKLKNYSSGMQVRIAFSVATRAQADVLLIDEVLAVGDAAFQRKCFEHFRTLKKSGTTIVFVTHDMGAVRQFCDRAILIEDSRLARRGSADDVAEKYTRLFTPPSPPPDARSETQEQRWGDGAIRYTRVTVPALLDDQDSLILELEAVAEQDVTEPAFGFAVKNSSGTTVLGTNSILKKQSVGSLGRGERISITWSVPNVFTDGLHHVVLSISDQQGLAMHDYWEEAASFTVLKEEKTPFIVTPDTSLVVAKAGITEG